MHFSKRLPILSILLISAISCAAPKRAAGAGAPAKRAPLTSEQRAELKRKLRGTINVQTLARGGVKQMQSIIDRSLDSNQITDETPEHLATLVEKLYVSTNTTDRKKAEQEGKKALVGILSRK